MHRVTTVNFEGPLDLLLQLIEEQKLDITQVSLAAVTEQYLTALQEIGGNLSAAALADFLAVAARLLLIKSRTLLPYLQPPGVDEGAELERQLKLYREYYLAAQQVNTRLRQKRFSFARERILAKDVPTGFTPPPNITAEKLSRVFAEVIAALPPVLAVAHSKIGSTISIQEKIQQLRDMIWKQAKLSFSQLLAQAQDRTEVIVSFLAILELTKQRHVMVQQDDLFQEIVIVRLPQSS